MTIVKSKNETDEQFRRRLYQGKYSGEIILTWHQISKLIEEQTGKRKSSDACRKEAKRYKYEVANETEDMSPLAEEIQDLIFEYKKERVKTSDERSQLNTYIRRLAREDTLIEIAKDTANKMSAKKILKSQPKKVTKSKSRGKEALLQLSDWHYGLEVNNHWNIFNPEVCVGRVIKLLSEVKKFCLLFDVSKIHIANLSDLIAGRIHNTIRIESREDTITQCIKVSEILAEFLADLAEFGLEVEYYDCLDNHSRLEPVKPNSLELESLARIIPWYLKTRLKDIESIHIHDNEFSDDIITFEVLDGKYKVVAVHGDKDKPSKVVKNMTMMTSTKYDLVLSAHLHHFSCDEEEGTVVVSNGSLMGTDSYAKSLRKYSKPSQNIILATDNSVVDYIHRIVLN